MIISTHNTFVVISLIPERANASIQQLSSALEPDGEVVRGGDDSFFTAVAEEDKTIWSQKTQSEAGDSLLAVCQKVSACLRHLKIFLVLFVLRLY